MKPLVSSVLAALVLASAGTMAQAPASAPEIPADPVITVEFSNPNLSPSHWTLTFHPDGRGHFRSKMGPANSSTGEMRVPDVDRDLQLSPRFAADAFQVAQRHKWFNQNCESHLKVAFQGWKTLSYAGAEGKGSCTFNYCRDKDIQSLGDSFVAVAETVVEGVRLEMLLQHDPLGLDQEIENLVAAARDGRAQQLCVIKDILERLAGDDNVMQMVRKQARLLLARTDT